MPADNGDAESYSSATSYLQTVRTRWNESDRGWRAIALGAGFLVLSLAHVRIPW